MPQHNKIAMYALYLLLRAAERLLWRSAENGLTFECHPYRALYFINHLYYMNVSQSRRREESAIKKLQNSKEIDTLYHEFQSLKSQIYGVKRQTKPKPIDVHWSNKNNKQKAIGMLRQSTIHKCQQQLQQNLTILQSSQPKTHKNLFKINSHNHSESDDYVSELREGNAGHHKNFSKKLKEYSQQGSLNFEQSLGQSLKVENLHFAEGEQIFRQFLSSNVGNINTSALSVSRREYTVQTMVNIQSLFNQITEDHLKKLNFLLETLTFMSRKLHCLQLIIQQYGKVLKARNEHNFSENYQQNQLILNVEAIQRKYEAQMKKLAQFYQQQLKKQTNKFVQNQIKNSKSNQSSSVIQQLREDNSRLTQLLRQAKDLISTKQQFIASLSEQNQELKQQLQKLKRTTLIRGSADSSLGYSVTADRNPKKQSSHQMGHISQRLNLALNIEKKDWDQFQSGSNDDINYSELQSVKDRHDRSIDDWDISHLDMRQNSNAKSLQQDCLKIMGNQRQNKEEQTF